MADRPAAIAVFADRDVRSFVTSRFFSAASHTLLHASIGWQIREIAGSAQAAAAYLGLVGLVEFVPVIPLSLVGGAVADATDRRRIVLLAQAAEWLGGLGLLVATARGHADLPVILALLLLLAAARSIEGPARSALLPQLVTREALPSAVTVQSTFQNLAWVSGPVLAGFAIDAGGVTAAYAANLALMAGAVVALVFVRSPGRAHDRRAVSLDSVREGIAFVRAKPVILGSMTLDMFAVIFASVTALLPIFAIDVLAVGPRGYGILSASVQGGSFLMAIALLVRPAIARPGRALLLAVGAFGLATIVFGVSRSFPLSVAALALSGMADQISMVTRHTIIQLATPDALRGRVNSVNLIFIGASNELGAMESGFLAALTSATFAVVFGGAACLAVLAGVTVKVPLLRNYRPEDSESA